MYRRLFLWALLGTIAHSYGQSDLKYNLNQNEVFTVKQEAEQVITQELEGTRHKLTNTIDGILEFKVLDRLEGNYIIQFKFKDLNLKVVSNLQGELMNVHAGNYSEDDPQSMLFHSLLENPVEMTLSPLGDILQVKGGDSLVGRMIASSGIEDEFTLEMMREQLEAEFGSEALSNSYEQMTYIYPKEQVSVGDSWNNEYHGKLSAKNTWTLEALLDSSAMIRGTADLVMRIEDPGNTVTLTGTQKTTITADQKTGFIRKMRVEGLSKGSGTMAQTGEREIPTTIVSTITYELIDQ